ncbi:MAG: ornithine cyclodeaminase [Paracoccaceae bacterium]|nr:ornithine cyclodeaminase [Paracoccaceae bacterium]
MTAPPPFIGPEAEAKLDWLALAQAIAAGHDLPKADLKDTFLYRGDDTVLSRAAWIDGLGIAVKTATVFPGNAEAGKPTIGGAVSLFDDTDGALAATLDFALVTKWKTAGDSLLAALRLAPPRVETILLVGAGRVASSMYAALGAGFPGARFRVWTRNPARAETFAEAHLGTEPVDDLERALGTADIVSSATMATEPVLRGDWLTPGTHVDLIGAYRADMREADDEVLTRGRLFVDARSTTIGHIGEVMDPIARGVISEADVLADFYELGRFARGPDDITVFKNGGGAHLDLMTARYILDAVAA